MSLSSSTACIDQLPSNLRPVALEIELEKGIGDFSRKHHVVVVTSIHQEIR
jgi:hypothetical protein